MLSIGGTVDRIIEGPRLTAWFETIVESNTKTTWSGSAFAFRASRRLPPAPSSTSLLRPDPP